MTIFGQCPAKNITKFIGTPPYSPLSVIRSTFVLNSSVSVEDVSRYFSLLISADVWYRTNTPWDWLLFLSLPQRTEVFLPVWFMSDLLVRVSTLKPLKATRVEHFVFQKHDNYNVRKWTQYVNDKDGLKFLVNYRR